MRSAIIMETKI